MWSCFRRCLPTPLAQSRTSRTTGKRISSTAPTNSSSTISNTERASRKLGTYSHTPTRSPRLFLQDLPFPSPFLGAPKTLPLRCCPRPFLRVLITKAYLTGLSHVNPDTDASVIPVSRFHKLLDLAGDQLRSMRYDGFGSAYLENAVDDSGSVCLVGDAGHPIVVSRVVLPSILAFFRSYFCALIRIYSTSASTIARNCTSFSRYADTLCTHVCRY